MAAPKRIGIVGAGTMGSGIAQKTAQSGLPVVLMDVGRAQLDAGLAKIRGMLAQGVARGVFRKGEPEAILGRIASTTEASDLADCDLVIEAVFENLDLKRRIFADLERHVAPDAILATNTSSYRVRAIAEGAAHPERILGLHYFYHPAMNRLLEVIGHPGTSAAAFERGWAFAEVTGKTAIRAKDAPGFVVNRFFVPWLNESVRLLEEGTADLLTIEETAKKLLGIGMGPFELMNVTGVPIAKHSADGLASELGPFYAACDRLTRQFESGKNWDLTGAASGRGADEVERRLLGVVLLIAATLVDEGVASIEDAEIGAEVGLRWRKGPFALANRKGIEHAVGCAFEVAERYGLPVPRLLASRRERGEPFAVRPVILQVEDGLARITMNRPTVMNALDPASMAALAEAFAAAEDDPSVGAIVIEGRGKAFVAGADIRFFLQSMDSGDLDRIVEFTRAGQETLLRIDRCAKPVVARLNGLALGGGAELALACDAVVAEPGAALGFPETGIGIYPALGGTQRLVHRAGLGVARYLVLTGEIVSAARAAELGLVDRVAEAGASWDVIRRLLADGAIPAGPGAGTLAAPVEAKGALDALFTDQNTRALLDGSFEPTDQAGERAKRRIAGKAPIALRLAERLLSHALGGSIETGTELERAFLREVFSTQDARAGLSSVGKSPPVFQDK